MQESWEIEWEDYYAILQVHPSAEPEVIKAAYGKLAQKYHPDTSKDPTASERMKKINIAYEVLSDTDKRKRYHAEWTRRSGKAAGWQGAAVGEKPRPVVDPQYIKFDDVEPGQIQASSFIIRNDGGPYANYEITHPSMNDPDSWLRIVDCYALTDSSELPAQAEIEAEGDDWDKTYSENIVIKLDEEATEVKVELKTKPEPARARVGSIPRTKRTTYAPPPPVTRKRVMPTWLKWSIGIAAFISLVIIISNLWPSGAPSQSTPSASSSKPEVAPTATEIRDQQIEDSLETWCQKNGQDTHYDSYGYVTVGEHIWAIVGSRVTPRLLRVIHSIDNGNTWEVQWENESTTWEKMQFFNQTDGLFATRWTITKTVDGGKTWNRLLTLGNMPGVSIWFVESFEAEDAQNILVYAMGHVNQAIQTVDGGETWELVVYHGRYYGSKTGNLRTYNGGESWQEIDVEYK